MSDSPSANTPSQANPQGEDVSQDPFPQPDLPSDGPFDAPLPVHDPPVKLRL